MNLTDAQMMARRLMNAHGLGNWTFEFDRSKRRLGSCSHFKQTITMSGYLTPLRDEDAIKNTILHEIAHALVGPSHGHDHVWRRKAIEIGCNGARCSNDLKTEDFASVSKYKLICPAGHISFRNRKGKYNRISCTKCYPYGFKEEHMYRWVQVR